MSGGATVDGAAGVLSTEERSGDVASGHVASPGSHSPQLSRSPQAASPGGSHRSSRRPSLGGCAMLGRRRSSSREAIELAAQATALQEGGHSPSAGSGASTSGWCEPRGVLRHPAPDDDDGEGAPGLRGLRDAALSEALRRHAPLRLVLDTETGLRRPEPIVNEVLPRPSQLGLSPDASDALEPPRQGRDGGDETAVAASADSSAAAAGGAAAGDVAADHGGGSASELAQCEPDVDGAPRTSAPPVAASSPSPSESKPVESKPAQRGGAGGAGGRVGGRGRAVALTRSAALGHNRDECRWRTPGAQSQVCPARVTRGDGVRGGLRGEPRASRHQGCGGPGRRGAGRRGPGGRGAAFRRRADGDHAPPAEAVQQDRKASLSTGEGGTGACGGRRWRRGEQRRRLVPHEGQAERKREPGALSTAREPGYGPLPLWQAAPT